MWYRSNQLAGCCVKITHTQFIYNLKLKSHLVFVEALSVLPAVCPLGYGFRWLVGHLMGSLLTRMKLFSCHLLLYLAVIAIEKNLKMG